MWLAAAVRDIGTVWFAGTVRVMRTLWLSATGRDMGTVWLDAAVHNIGTVWRTGAVHDIWTVWMDTAVHNIGTEWLDLCNSALFGNSVIGCGSAHYRNSVMNWSSARYRNSVTAATVHDIGQFSEADFHEWMPFVMFRSRSRERSQLPLPGRFLSRRWFAPCITIEAEPRTARQYNLCQYCCVCKNYRGKWWRMDKRVCIVSPLTRR